MNKFPNPINIDLTIYHGEFDRIKPNMKKRAPKTRLSLTLDAEELDEYDFEKFFS